MAIYHPSRGGVRGGGDQFDWQDVKTDKYRENYLGHSLKAPTGRWQRGKDLLWFERKDGRGAADEQQKIRAEREHIKREEQILMEEKLGIRKKRERRATAGFEKSELQEILQRGTTEHDEEYSERKEGIGHAPVNKHDGVQLSGHALLDHVTPVALPEVQDMSQLTQPAPQPSGGSTSGVVVPIISDKAKKEKRKEKKKKKKARKEKKEKKRKKKEMKKQKRLEKERERIEKDIEDVKRKTRKRHRHSPDVAVTNSGHFSRRFESEKDARRSKKTRRHNSRSRSRSPPYSSRKRRSYSSSPERGRLDTPSPSPKRQRRLDTPSPSPRRRASDSKSSVRRQKSRPVEKHKRR